ncbi:hypothetical protein AGMMS49983_13910 [Clostridia bacterium]|nr:hypothetical protein AGMMS49983_13910 [Clostridia bacterium]
MSAVHDNIIKSYFVDMRNGILRVDTEYCGGSNGKENTVVTFEGVFTHLFADVLEKDNNIIFDITEGLICDFLADNRELLKNRKNYGWPCVYENEPKLLDLLNSKKLRYFKMESSYGLFGWILAEDMKITTNGVTKRL